MLVIHCTMFKPDIDSLAHTQMLVYRSLLDERCRVYGGHVKKFSVDRGVVSFGTSDDAMTNDIHQELAGKGFAIHLSTEDDSDQEATLFL